MATIDNLTLDINLNDNASAKLEKLAGALSALKDLSISGAKFNGIAKGVNNLNTAINNITDESIARLEKLANALASIGAIDASSISKVARAVGKFSSNTANTGNAQRSAYSALKNQIVPVTVTQEPFEGKASSADDVREFYGSYREVGEEILQTKEKLKQGFGETESEFKARVDSIAQSMRNLAGTPFRVLGKAFVGLGSAIKKIMAPLNGFIRSLGRIALYRALRGIIKAISSGIKEGVQNLAQFSKLMNEMDTHKANRVMSLYASNFLYLKNTIATAVIPILKTLEPIVSSIINKVIDLTNVIAQLFSAISGSATYTKAKYYYVDYAESLDKASGSASKLNKQLAKFDELNNLTTSSGSGKDNALDYLEMFEDPVPIADWIQKLKDNIQSGNWEAIGQAIADKVKYGLGSINWTSEFEKSFNAGKGFASFLNGLVDPEAFHEVGKTIAGAIMMGINFALGFAEEFKFDELGLAIAEGINGFFKNFDGKKAADAITKIAHGLEEAFTTAVKKIKWKEVFKDLGTLIGKVTIDNLDLILKGVVIYTVAKLAISFGAGVMQELSRQISAKIASKLAIKLTGLSISEIGTGLGAGAAGKILGGGAGSIIGTIIGEIFSWIGVAAIVAIVGLTLWDMIKKISTGRSPFEGGWLSDLFTEDTKAEIERSDWGKSKNVGNNSIIPKTTGASKYDRISDEAQKRLETLNTYKTEMDLAERTRTKYQQIYDTHAAEQQKRLDALSEYKKKLESFNKYDKIYDTTAADKQREIDSAKSSVNIARDKYQQIYDTHAATMQKMLDTGETTITGWVEETTQMTNTVRDKYQQIYDTSAAAMQKLKDEGKNVDTTINGTVTSVTKATNTVRSKYQQIYDTHASAMQKMLDQTKNGAGNVSSSYAQMGDNISNASSTAFANVSNASSSASSSVNNNIDTIKTNSKNTFSASTWTGYGNNIKSGLTPAFSTAMNSMKTAWTDLRNFISNNPIKTVIQTSISGAVSGATSVIEAAAQVVEKYNNTPAETTIASKIRVKNPHYSNAYAQRAWEQAHPKDKYEWYAKGGFPSEGSMFFAGESGAELVGNINGRTGVANTDQITEAMYTATYDAMSTALAENPSRFIIEGDADGMFRIIQQKANNFLTRTGRAAF